MQIQKRIVAWKLFVGAPRLAMRPTLLIWLIAGGAFLSMSGPVACLAEPEPASPATAFHVERLALIEAAEDLELEVLRLERQLVALAQSDSIRSNRVLVVHKLDLQRERVAGYMEGYNHGAGWGGKLGFIGGVLAAGGLVALGAVVF